MLSLSVLCLVLSAADPVWHTDYSQATALAKKEKKDLVIYFREKDGSLDKALQNPEIKKRLSKFVCLQVPESYQFQGARLLDHGALVEMMGQAGLVVVSYSDDKLPQNQEVISAHPLVSSRYRWVPDYGVNELAVTLDLPATATLTQRSMIYAIRVHPERPQSVYAHHHPAFMAHARRHSYRQASMRNQHHANIISTSHNLENEMGTGLSRTSEVVAESWGRVVGGENVLEASFSCVDAWRHSSGHWGAVSRSHRYFGYDIARGDNGTWYATGIFAD